ncbi:gas vesicle protein GVPa [Desulfofarcimen acetoxidans DSM 771]|uniref:Gas vesicle protein GVPa n=1 Tax=Desulfofarcimen acetoxidans (strain ATCC 49208 / DSM 771 / KCTC 5769 / VKM B-1644 / 5575) TaxID=485916 RepID=C8W3I8_DESAS|nr:gas vesicle protein [Desulfofarcimen acetoxidans]ACV63774.1 gas vesicle protein GVPa [Desulfofarcimen acetoxidans DSM 771]
MLPIREERATLTDLLDRVLDKGLLLNADILISVAGVPLIGITLKAAIAGMETMKKYGLLIDWDQESRLAERRLRSSRH